MWTLLLAQSEYILSLRSRTSRESSGSCKCTSCSNKRSICWDLQLHLCFYSLETRESERPKHSEKKGKKEHVIMSPSECKQWPFVQNSVSSISLYTWFQCHTYKRMCCQGVAGILIGVFVAENTGIIIRCFQFPLRVCQLLLSPSAQCGCTNTHKSTHTHTPAPHSPRMPTRVTQVWLTCNAFENLDDL